MKKHLVTLIILIFIVIIYNYYKNYKHSLIIGNPVFNKNIEESIKNKMFISSFSVLERNDSLFNEIWVERRAYFTKRGIEYNNRYVLIWTYRNSNIQNFFSKGFISNTCIIKDNNSQENLINKDTLKINIIYNNKNINKTFLRNKIN